MPKTHTPLVFLVVLAVVLPSAATRVGAQAPAGDAQTCIAVVLPSVKGASGDATAFADALRERFVSFLTGPSLRAITLDARLPSQAIEEARQKQCGHVLLTSVEVKRHDGSGLGRALGRAAGTAAWYGVPYGGAASAAARGAAVAGAQVISEMASTTKAKDEVILEYRFGTVDAVTRTSPKTEKAKAQSDGEDLLTPLVEQASESVAASVARK